MAAWRIENIVRRRMRRDLCPRCGYDRRGLAADAKCPECGSVPSPK
jgi:rubrerythrin